MDSIFDVTALVGRLPPKRYRRGWLPHANVTAEADYRQNVTAEVDYRPHVTARTDYPAQTLPQGLITSHTLPETLLPAQTLPQGLITPPKHYRRGWLPRQTLPRLFCKKPILISIQIDFGEFLWYSVTSPAGKKNISKGMHAHMCLGKKKKILNGPPSLPPLHLPFPLPLRFVVVRDPADRILSCFLNKCLGGEWNNCPYVEFMPERFEGDRQRNASTDKVNAYFLFVFFCRFFSDFFPCFSDIYIYPWYIFFSRGSWIKLLNIYI